MEAGENALPHIKAIEQNFDVLQRCTDVSAYVIACLRAEDVLDAAQESSVNPIKNQFERNVLLYNWLKETRDVSKYETFLRVMERKDVGQQHVSNLLRGNVEDHDLVPLSESNYTRLVRNRPKLMNAISGLNIDEDLLSRLKGSRAISDTDYDEIDAQKTSHKKSYMLLGAVMRRSNESYNLLKQALIDTNQNHLAAYLDAGEITCVHVNTSRPDLDADLSAAFNKAVVHEPDVLSPLNGICLHAIMAQPGNSIEILIYCCKMKDIETFIEFLNSGTLEKIICCILNRLMRKIEPYNTNKLKAIVTIDEAEACALEEVTGIEDGFKDESKLRRHCSKSVRSAAVQCNNDDFPETRGHFKMDFGSFRAIMDAAPKDNYGLESHPKWLARSMSSDPYEKLWMQTSRASTKDNYGLKSLSIRYPRAIPPGTSIITNENFRKQTSPAYAKIDNSLRRLKGLMPPVLISNKCLPANVRRAPHATCEIPIQTVFGSSGDDYEFDPVIFKTELLHRSSVRESNTMVSMTILKEELYVTYSRSSAFDIYDCANCLFKEHKSINDITDPMDIASCSLSNCVYVLNQSFSPKRIIEILKFDSSFVNAITKWAVPRGSCHKISVHNGQIILSFTESDWAKIIEYDSNGSIAGRVNLNFDKPPGAAFYWQAVRNRADGFVGVVKQPFRDKIELMMIDNEGRLVKNIFIDGDHSPPLKNFLGKPPYLLTTDKMGNVLFVANSKIYLFNSSLKLKRELTIGCAACISVEESGERLYAIDIASNSLLMWFLRQNTKESISVEPTVAKIRSERIFQQAHADIRKGKMCDIQVEESYGEVLQ